MSMTGSTKTDSTVAARAWTAAQSLVGTPFRLHGRDAAHGLDCVGLVALAYAMGGLSLRDVPASYRLRGTPPADAERWMMAAGFVPAPDEAADGDVLLSHPGRGQLHLMLAGRVDGAMMWVHAHAGLRRIVLMPPPVDAPPHSRWRFSSPTTRQAD